MVSSAKRPSLGCACAGAAIVTVVCISGAASPASAQWTVTNLHPTGATGSQANAAYGHQQAGRVGITAALWQGDGGSWVSLQPADASSSVIYGMRANSQVGSARMNGRDRAGMWNGTADSWVDLHPGVGSNSRATAVDGEYQVGTVDFVGVESRASLWRGTAASWVDLHPAGARQSVARGVSGNVQVGFVAPSLQPHAALWRGSADSWVDLNPRAASVSEAEAAGGSQQVGYSDFGGTYDHAALWYGTADSAIDLNPGITQESYAHATDGRYQVGDTRQFNAQYRHASLWNGTRESWVDLSQFLTGSWGTTTALAVWSDGSVIHVVGSGFNLQTNRTEALLWTRVIPAPSAAATLAMAGVFALRRRRTSPHDPA